jgi:hypothetical protein
VISPTNPFIYPSINQSIHPFIHPSINQSISPLIQSSNTASMVAAETGCPTSPLASLHRGHDEASHKGGWRRTKGKYNLLE